MYLFKLNYRGELFIIAKGMRRKNLFILGIIFLLGILFLGIDRSKATVNDNIFDCILKDTNGEIVEYGLITNFQHYWEGEKVCKKILKNLNINQNDYRDTIKNEKIYCIEFDDNNLEGYIQNTRYDNDNIITINIKGKNKANELDKLEEELTGALKDENVRFFKYVKARIDEKDLQKTNKDIITLLKDFRGENIETIKIDHGYSTIAYIKKYNPININGKPIDFNYALCSYNSGNYIIMGTPEILISY